MPAESRFRLYIGPTAAPPATRPDAGGRCTFVAQKPLRTAAPPATRPDPSRSRAAIPWGCGTACERFVRSVRSARARVCDFVAQNCGIVGDSGALKETACLMEKSVLLSFPSMAADLTTVCFKVKPPDLALLEALEELEQLKRSDVIRRAIRAYAKQLGVEAEPKKPKRR